MPQPLSSMGISSIITGDVTAARPEHAAAALRIIIAAAEAQLTVGKVLVGLSPTNGKRLAMQYNAQESDAKKGATVETAAATLLTPEKQELILRVLAKHRSMQKERTPFAHWVYGYSVERHDLLVLVDPKKELLAEADFAYIHHNWIDEGLNPAPPDAREAMLAKREESISATVQSAWGYNLEELKRIATRLQIVTGCLHLFQRATLWKGDILAQDVLFETLEQNLRVLD